MPVNDDNSITGLTRFARSRTSGYIKQKSYYLLCAMPTEIGATASTYFCDYFWESSASSKGLRVRLSGASANDGTVRGRLLRIRACSLDFVCVCVRSPLFFEADPSVLLKTKTEKTEREAIKDVS